MRSRSGRTRRLAAAVAAAAVLLVVAGCVPEPAEGEARRDPAPVFGGTRTTQVDEAGARWTHGDVTVDVPRDAIRVRSAGVAVGEPLGRADSGIAAELFGTPVRIEATAAFAQPVEIAWDVSGLPPHAAETAALVEWDAQRRVWTPAGAPVLADGTLRADVTGSAVISWAAPDVRAAEPLRPPDPTTPECGPGGLPGWVTTYAAPGPDRPDAALRMCAEAHQSDTLTVRSVNTGTVARILELTEGASVAWATRHADPGHFWSLAAAAVERDGAELLPPGAELSLGIERPGTGTAGAGEPVRAVARVDAFTAAVDLTAAFFRTAGLGEVPAPETTALAAGLLSCAAATGEGTIGRAADVAAVATGLTSCAQRLADGDTSEGRGFAAETAAAASALGQADPAAARRVQGERAVSAALRLAAAGVFEELVPVLAEPIAAAAASPVGGASWLVVAHDDAPALGAWSARCTDAEADAVALLTNLTGRPEFADPSRSLASHPSWRGAVEVAVAPLAHCTPDERRALAAALPDVWSSPGAAGAAVEALDGLGIARLTCDDLFDLADPLTSGFHPVRDMPATGTGRTVCGWSSEPDLSLADAPRTHVQVWVSRERADADEVDRRRTEAERSELGGPQDSPALDAVDGFVLGAYVPSGLELESWLPGYRIVVTATSADDPAQWRMAAGVAAVERIATALATR
ncbi:hypothetical protein [Microbacterium album]|uniref:hypothetical protein n=1 Tax=Microbacterium album TaxID=2053191 RepID=UPI00166F2523|nr:hypothetical protein [Microbacterium album]